VRKEPFTRKFHENTDFNERSNKKRLKVGDASIRRYYGFVVDYFGGG